MPWSGLANPKSPILTTFPKPTIQFRKARSLIAIKQNGTWKRDHNLNGPYITLRLASVSDNIGRIVCFPKMEIRFSFLPHVRNSDSRNFYLLNPESWALESGIQLKESGIPQTWDSRIQVPGIRNPRRGIQNPRLSWFPYIARSFPFKIRYIDHEMSCRF